MDFIQVGLGWWGRNWAELLAQSPTVAHVAIVDPAPNARAWAEQTLGLPRSRCFAFLDEALAASDAPSVLITTPPETHRDLAVAALAGGRHVLLEKPLALSITDAEDIVSAAERARRIVVVAQQYRFRPAARVAQRLVAQDAIGELLAVRVAFRRDTRTLFGEGDFRYQMRHPLVLDMMIHHADLLRSVTGRDVRAVDARGWRVPDSPYLHDPAVAALLTLENGAAVAYDGDWAAHGNETSWDAEWELIGETGRLIWTGATEGCPLGDVSLQLWGSEPIAVTVPEPEQADRMAVLQSFLLAADMGKRAETAAADNIRSLAIVLGCVESIESGRQVELA